MDYVDSKGRPTAKYVRNEKEFINFLARQYADMAKVLQKGLEFNPDHPQTIRQVEIMRQIQVMIRQLDKPMYERIEKYIKTAYMEGRAYHMLSVGDAKTLNEALKAQSWNKVNRDMVEALVSDTYKDILLATQNTEKHIKELVRDTVRKVAQYHAVKNTNHKEQAEQLKRELSKKGLSERIVKEGFVGITDKAGRRWDLGVYSNMVMKTKINDAFKQGVIQRSIDTGFDLAIISDHSADDACSKWEGVVISMTGATKGYPTYAEVRSTNEIFHPNCEHTIHPIRSLDMLHPDDIAQAQKKAKALGYEPPKVTDKAKPVRPSANPQAVPQRESLYELVKNTDTEIFKKIGEDNYDKLHSILHKAPQLQREVWAKFESDLKVIDAKSKKHPHCMGVQGVVMDVTKDGQGSSWSAPYQTTVHEFSHNIDYIANVKYGTGSKYQPFSYTYKDNLFGKTLQQEFDEFVKKVDKELKAEFKKNKDNPDWLLKNHFISDWEYKAYKEHGKWIYGEPKYKKAFAYSSIEREIREIPLNERADLSDIMEGASKAKVNGGFGHGKKYWADRPHGLPCEAFAEMMDSSVANKKQFEAIKKYFPKSVIVFEEILEKMLGGS